MGRVVVYHNGISSVKGLSKQDIDVHLRIAAYQGFTLTNAIRPSYDERVIPQKGFTFKVYMVSKGRNCAMPYFTVSAPKEILFDLFMDLIGELIGKRACVQIQSRHCLPTNTPAIRFPLRDFTSPRTDMVIVKSCLYDFEETLLDDGLLGISVFDSRLVEEVELDDHKLISIKGWAFLRTVLILQRYGIPYVCDMRFLTDDEHIHMSSEELRIRFKRLKSLLGCVASPIFI